MFQILGGLFLGLGIGVVGCLIIILFLYGAAE
jgi:hypothetical protein